MRPNQIYTLNALTLYNNNNPFLIKENSLLSQFSHYKLTSTTLKHSFANILKHSAQVSTTPKIVYRSQEHLHRKFYRMFIRHGNVEQIFKLFANAGVGHSTIHYSKVDLHTTLKLLISNATFTDKSMKVRQLLLTPGTSLRQLKNIGQLLPQLLLDHLPTFTFKVQKVDKNVQKFSRGKSGKYSLAWSYLPPKRRWLTVLQWLKKELLFQKNQTLQDRINQSFATLLHTPSDTLLVNTRRFVHNFVFRKFRKVIINLIRYKL